MEHPAGGFATDCCTLPLPGSGQLRLHLVPFVAAEFELGAFEKAGIRLPPAVAQSVVKRQAEFFFGRLAARAALLEQGATALEVPIGPAREPVWPPHFVGSISHIDGLAAAVVAPSARHTGLGIDLERTAHGQDQDALRQIAVDAEELALLSEDAGPLSLDELVTLAFSAKESLYKGLYSTVGRFFGFEAARLEAIDPVRGVISLRLTEELCAPFRHGSRHDIAFARLGPDTFITAFDAAHRESNTQLLTAGYARPARPTHRHGECLADKTKRPD